MTLELESDVGNPNRVLEEVRIEIDRIPSFPLEAEDPEIRSATMRRPAIRVGVLGPAGDHSAAEMQLREVAERVRDNLLLMDEISQVELTGARDYQIDVEIAEDALQAHASVL